jgi:hypothetical protein
LAKIVFLVERRLLSANKTTAHKRAKNPKSHVRIREEGVACGSVSGPPNLQSFAAIHREAPNIPLDPPRNGPDVTQIKNFRQHKSNIFYNAFSASAARARKKIAL